MPKLVIEDAPERTGPIYPEPYAAMMAGRSSRRPGEMAGLSQFGVDIVTRAPGAVASLRHWHLREDEFAIVLEGALVRVEEGGEVAMGPGGCAAWGAGVANGHRFVNRGAGIARFPVVGSTSADECVTCADVDMKIHFGPDGARRVTHHDGSDWTGPRAAASGGGTR
jgi:uncharacterized cupin superfamily protein